MHIVREAGGSKGQTVRSCLYGNREINAHVVGTAETRALHRLGRESQQSDCSGTKDKGPAELPFPAFVNPQRVPQPSSGETGEWRKMGAKPLQVQSTTLNATGVSSRPLTEATENQLPDGSPHRKKEGLRFDVSLHHHPVLVSKARIVGSEMENNCQRKPSQHPPHPEPCPHFTEGSSSCG